MKNPQPFKHIVKPGEVEVEVIATCGHPVKFWHDPKGRYASDRMAKFRDNDCGSCRQAAALKRDTEGAVEKAIRTGKAKKGTEVKLLPPGSLMVLRREASGEWTGGIQANDVSATAKANALISLIAKLAKAWLKNQAGAGEPDPEAAQPAQINKL